MNAFLGRALVSGAIAAAAVTAVAAIASRRETGSYPAAINATSHFLWDRRAAREDGYSWKYTATGFFANLGASIFWALLYESLAPRRGAPDARDALLRATAVSAIAYVTDYHVVPKRLTPGFELVLPRVALVPVYAALALGLAVRDLTRRRSVSPFTAPSFLYAVRAFLLRRASVSRPR